MQVKQIYEFRGCSERITKKNTKVFCLNFEGENGEGYQFFTNDENTAKSLVKGQRYVVSFSISGYAFLNNIAPIK